MRRRSPVAAAVTISAALALVGTACGDGGDAQEAQAPTPMETASPQAAPTTDSGAAELRANLTSLLEEHVYLAGIAVNAAVSGGDFDAAAATLDENSAALADAVGSVYGQDARDAFLELWRTHIGFFVDYTNAKAKGYDQAAQQAVEDLDGYRQDFGAFLSSANPQLTTEAVAEELVPHVETVLTAIDAAVAGDPSVYGELRAAAQVMPGTANVLAGAIVAQFPEMFA